MIDAVCVDGGRLETRGVELGDVVVGVIAESITGGHHQVGGIEHAQAQVLLHCAGPIEKIGLVGFHRSNHRAGLADPRDAGHGQDHQHWKIGFIMPSIV